ncbi:Type III restriction/modification enzyme methylation subunit, partial [Haemophilus influenzae]
KPLLLMKLTDFLTQKHSQNSLATPQTANKPLAKSNAILTAF